MSRFSELLVFLFPRYAVPGKIKRRAKLPANIRIRIENDPAVGAVPTDPCDPFSQDRVMRVRLRRRGDVIAIGCDLRGLRRGHLTRMNFLAQRVAVLVRLLAEADARVEGFVGTASDFCPGGVVGFSSNDPTAILVPDSDFLNTGGYAFARELAPRAPPWRERDDRILWRGSTTGIGLTTDGDMSGDNPALIQRTRLCLVLKNVPRADSRFATGRPEFSAEDQARLRQTDILGEMVPLSEWAGLRFAVDVDGQTNAWSNLFNRLLLGCCVIKVQSERGFRQWYYDDLVPWRHFVPVKADMSDLVEKVAWCRSHSDECEAIAAAGQGLAMAMTFEREIARGAESINRAFGRGHP